MSERRCRRFIKDAVDVPTGCSLSPPRCRPVDSDSPPPLPLWYQSGSDSTMQYYDAPVYFSVQLKPYPSPLYPPSAPSSPVPIPISFEKAQRIHMWRVDVERCRPSSSNPFPMEPLMDPYTPDTPSGFHPFQSEFGFAGTPNGLPLELYYWPQEEADMDRFTVVNDGDLRLVSLPHPGANPLVSDSPSSATSKPRLIPTH